MIDTTVNNLIINKLTKELYDAIQYKSDTELYLIPDEIDTAPTSGSSNPVTSNGIYTALLDKLNVIDAQHKLSADLVDDSTTTNKLTNATEKQTWNNKQDALVSGTNIKTINNGSIVGSGNIDTSEVFWATKGTTTATEIDSAVSAGKIVMCAYDGKEYRLSNTASGLPIIFSCDLGATLWRLTLDRTTGNWSNPVAFYYELTSNRKSSWQSTPDNTHYPSEKLVYDSLYKRGVISQTQTWTQAADGGYDYVMSDLVYGDIPRANIDLFVSAGAVFNETSGYFELNGLTDISYEEMGNIYAAYTPNPWTGQQGMLIFKNARTNLPPNNNIISITSFSGLRLCYNSSNAEVIVLLPGNDNAQISNMQLAFFRLMKLKKIISPINVSSTTNYTQAFEQNCSLTEISLKNIKSSLSFYQSPRLSTASILYMIQNEASTSAITITLHPTAYARAIADSDVQAALQSHTNVTLASA